MTPWSAKHALLNQINQTLTRRVRGGQGQAPRRCRPELQPQ